MQLLILQMVLCIIDLSNGFGVIEDTNNSSEIEISWGPVYLEIICAYEEDIYGCIGEETCLVIDIIKPLSVKERDLVKLNIFPNI